MGTAAVQLAVIVPCFNEQDALPATIARLVALKARLVGEGAIGAASTITFVDDGSADGTWSLIERAAAADPSIHGIKLSRNSGHQNALIAGLLSVPGDVLVSVDADLQDDLDAIGPMLGKCREGAQIVYGVRNDRGSDTPFKRITAEAYYRLMRLFGVDLVFNHADYRLMTRTAIVALEQYGEVNLFLRGIVPRLGFKTASVHYARGERVAGESKYPLRKMLALAWEGLSSFSPSPLRWITVFGLVISLFSFLTGCWALAVTLFFGGTVPGWASTVVPIYFLGGIQMLSLGIIGEYISKTYLETKRRPRYIIEKKV
ncbi:MAG: glycosyltransferase family 2 protein [Alphaproteobacteria bacterium]|nr:glycosyltransferase family 2 protein [Alphaproteobacteria bacterium]